MSHGDLAKLVQSKLEGLVDNPAWWAQGITVAYEQHIGKRVPGQLADGTFEIAVSKSVNVRRNELFQQVSGWFDAQKSLNNQEVLNVRSSETPKRSSWRCDFVDKSKFAATVEENGDNSKLVLSHTAIPTKQQADGWKEFWRSIANKLG